MTSHHSSRDRGIDLGFKISVLTAWAASALAQSSALLSQAGYHANCIALINTSSIYIFTLITSGVGLIGVTALVAFLAAPASDGRMPPLWLARSALTGSVISIVLGFLLALLFMEPEEGDLWSYLVIVTPFAISGIAAVLILTFRQSRGRGGAFLIGGMGLTLMVASSATSVGIAVTRCGDLDVASGVGWELFVWGWIGVVGLSTVIAGLAVAWWAAVRRPATTLVAISATLLLVGSAFTLVSYVRGLR